MLTFIKRHLPAGKAAWLMLLYLSIYFIAINLVVLNRFRQYEALYFDHGIFDSSLWQVAHLQTPTIDHLEDGFISQFGDHFTPTLYLLAPIYWFTSAYEPVLVAGNILVVASAWVLYLIAKSRIKNNILVFAIIFAYTLFIGLQNTIIANLHSELPALLTLALTLWAIERKKWKLFWVFLLLTLGCKQNFAAIGVGLGMYLFFIKEKKTGLATIIFSLLYYLAATKFFIPLLGNRQYGYITNFTLGWSQVKTETMFVSFATFGFLPIGAITFLPSIIQDFFTRFFFSGAARWDLGLHYNATLAVLLAYGTILTAGRLGKKTSVLFAFLIILATVYFHRFKYHGPLGLAYNPDFYKHTAEMKFETEFLKQIPPNKSVMTNNNLAPYLTHTNTVMLFTDLRLRNPEVIALDIRPGQNPVNFWPANEHAIIDLKNRLATDSSYIQSKISNEEYIFTKRTIYQP